MKRPTKTILISALAGMAGIGIAGPALANRITLINKTPEHPIKVVYRVAYKNPNEETILSRQTKAAVLGKENVTIVIPQPEKYQYVGIVPVGIGKVGEINHRFHAKEDKFATKESVSLATDKANPDGKLIFSYQSSDGDKHGLIQAKKKGGIFGRS